MKSIGSLIKEGRKRRRLSIDRLSQQTKIKPRYIRAMEKEEWQIIPNFAVARGFIQNVAAAVGIDPETAAALLRRDFQEKKTSPVTARQIWWTPRITVTLFSVVVAGAVLFYLTSQYLTYVAPPPLSAQVVKNGGAVVISGKTDKEASVLVNGEPALVQDDGTFKISVNAKDGDSLTIEALSRSGKATKKEVVVP